MAWFQWVFGINTASDIWWILKYQKQYLCQIPKEIMLLFVYNMRLRKYSSVTRGESFCCIWPLPASLLSRERFFLSRTGFCTSCFCFFFFVFFFSCFLFQHFSLTSWISSSSISGYLSAIWFENQNTTASVAMALKLGWNTTRFNQSPFRNFLACIINIQTYKNTNECWWYWCM